MGFFFCLNDLVINIDHQSCLHTLTNAKHLTTMKFLKLTLSHLLKKVKITYFSSFSSSSNSELLHVQQQLVLTSIQS